MGTNDSVISENGTQAEFGLFPLLHQSMPMSDEITQVSNVLRGEPNARDIPGSREIGEELGVGPIGLVGRLLHSGDVTGMGEIDGPLETIDEDFVEIGDAGTGFDCDLDIRAGAEGDNDTMNGIGIVLDGLIEKDFSVVVHDTDLNHFLVVVKTDKNW